MNLENLEIIENESGIIQFKTTCSRDDSCIHLAAENIKVDDYYETNDIELYFDVHGPEYYSGTCKIERLMCRIKLAVKCLFGFEIAMHSRFHFRNKEHFNDFIDGLCMIRDMKQHEIVE